ncbi:MAG: hypothetical protein AAF531_21005 [Actinomycetota bacterium]
MNFVGHVRVAIDQGGDRDRLGFLIGAALPDIAAMGRFRLTNRPTDPDVQAGVALHHRTDDAFHGHPWFRDHSAAVTGNLLDAGLPRGAARACGHVGVELLLDGYLLASGTDNLGGTTGEAMAAVNRPEFGLADLVDAEHRPDWGRHLRRTAGWPLPDDYREPAAVAHRLQRILDRRPRLRFDAEQADRVAQILADRRPLLEQGADELLAELAVAVGPSTAEH